MATAYGRVGRASPLVRRVAEEATRRVGLDQFRPSELATLMWGLAKACSGSRDDPGALDDDDGALVRPETLKMFADAFAARASTFAPRDVALSAWSLATLNPAPQRFETKFSLGGDADPAPPADGNGDGDPHLDADVDESTRDPALVAVEAAATPALREYNPQDLSNLAWAFAKLDHRPGVEFQSEFEEAALASLADFNAQSLANTAYAYAALQLPGAKTVLPYVSAYLEDRMRECGATEIVMVLWSYARCGFDPGARAIASSRRRRRAWWDPWNRIS